MNYFAHALPFLDRPYFVAGAAVPDWLAVIERRLRVRAKHAEAFRHDARSVGGGGGRRRVATPWRRRPLSPHAGLRRNLAGVDRFLSRSLSGASRTLRPAFLGHVLVELLLDAALIAESPRAT